MYGTITVYVHRSPYVPVPPLPFLTTNPILALQWYLPHSHGHGRGRVHWTWTRGQGGKNGH